MQEYADGTYVRIREDAEPDGWLKPGETAHVTGYDEGEPGDFDDDGATGTYSFANGDADYDVSFYYDTEIQGVVEDVDEAQDVDQALFDMLTEPAPEFQKVFIPYAPDGFKDPNHPTVAELGKMVDITPFSTTFTLGKWPEAEEDVVNHPSHYTGFSNGVEVIDIAENLNFNRGNAVKYLARAGAKDPATEMQDLLKAQFYVNREVNRLDRIIAEREAENG